MGKHVVSISERRYHPDKNDYSRTQSEYSLTLWTANPPPGYDLTAFSLTPRIRDVIVPPDGKVIAYLALDIHSWYGIYFYYPDSGEVVGIAYCSTGSVIEAFQLSTDLEHIRYYVEPDVDIDKPIYDADPNRPTKKSFKQLLVGAINGQWIAMALNPPGGYLFSKKEQDQIDWAPIQRPKEIPAFLAQPVPKIQRDTQVQWSPDSKSLYLLDDQGIWRSDIGKQRYVYQWTQIVKKRAISRFQLSPTGTTLALRSSGRTGDRTRRSGLSTFNPIHQTKLERAGQRLSVMMATLSFTGTLKSIASTISMARNISSLGGSVGHLSE